MNESDFTSESPGKLHPISIPYRSSDEPAAELHTCNTIAFIPEPLPPNVDWDRLKVEQFDRYQETVAALNRLNGLHKRVGNAASLLRTLWMREAKLSSEIEDINTTGFDLVLAGGGRQLEVRQQGLESWNYVRALEHGVESKLPMSLRLMREMHGILLEGVADAASKRPGRFRDVPVYIGDRNGGLNMLALCLCRQVTC